MGVDIRRSTLFDGLSDEAFSVIKQAFRSINLAPGQVLFEASEPGHALYLIRRGKVKISHANLDGKEKLLAFLNPGDIFGEMSLVDESPRSARAVAVEASALFALYKQEYFLLIERFPLLAHNLARILAQRLREMNREAEVLTFEESRGKVAYALLKLYRHQYGEKTSQGRLMKLTQRELSELAATSRETVTRVVAELIERGVLKGGVGSIEVLDVATLEKVLYDLE